MSDFLTRLAQRTIAPRAAIQPRPRSQFERQLFELKEVGDAREAAVAQLQPANPKDLLMPEERPLPQQERAQSGERASPADQPSPPRSPSEPRQSLISEARRLTAAPKAEPSLLPRAKSRPSQADPDPPANGFHRAPVDELPVRAEQRNAEPQQVPSPPSAISRRNGAPEPDQEARVTKSAPTSAERSRQQEKSQASLLLAEPQALLRRLPPRPERMREREPQLPPSITIGRIDVQSPQQAARANRPPSGTPPVSLAEYLRKREGKK